MVEERYSPFQLIPDRNKSNAGSQGCETASEGDERQWHTEWRTV